VRCLKAANPALEVLHDGACTVQEVEKIVGLDDVCRMAMHRYEWNPICGADNVTYTNAYTFLCAAKKTPEDKSKTTIFRNTTQNKVDKITVDFITNGVDYNSQSFFGKYLTLLM
jgi:Kazal-type serine protease inhibitor domain